MLTGSQEGLQGSAEPGLSGRAAPPAHLASTGDSSLLVDDVTRTDLHRACWERNEEGLALEMSRMRFVFLGPQLTRTVDEVLRTLCPVR